LKLLAVIPNGKIPVLIHQKYTKTTLDFKIKILPKFFRFKLLCLSKTALHSQKNQATREYNIQETAQKSISLS
jgi:hypothetical protein